MKKALLYEKLDNGLLHCFLCAHHCRIAEGSFGFCGVRQNVKGVLYTHVYGKLIAAAVDPIEKKPFYHFLPGSLSFSIATIGCNFRCGFCQNWQISQENIRDGAAVQEKTTAPQEVVRAALEAGSESIAYTYTEPTIFFEYALEVARLAKEKGLRNIFVTNGFMTAECLQAIGPFLDAANVDLKAFREESYAQVCAGRLKPVLDSISLMKKMGVWVEVTTLIVPDFNDSQEELRGIAGFLCSVDKDIPWHISRFHPEYKFSGRQATPEKTLRDAVGIGKACGLRYMYAGNVYGWGNDTVCHHCGRALITREFFQVKENRIEAGACAFCGTVIPGVFPSP